MFHGAENLKEDIPRHVIIANVSVLLGNVGEQINLWAILHDHVCAINIINDLDPRHNILMTPCLSMQVNFSLLEALLSWFKASTIQSLDCISNMRSQVNCC